MTDGENEDTAAEAAAGESKSPEQIRVDIERTREQLGDTVEAQAKNRISAVKETAQQKKDDFVAKAKQAAPTSATAGAGRLTSTVQTKPVPFTVAGAFAIGLAIGWLLGRH